MMRKINSMNIVALCLAVMTLLSCATANPNESIAAKAGSADKTSELTGVWIDRETTSFHTIVKTDTGYVVTGITDGDDEGKIDILSSEWKDGVLSWKYFVAGTGYTVTFTMIRLDGDRLEAKWVNDDGKDNRSEGTEILERSIPEPAKQEVSDPVSPDE